MATFGRFPAPPQPYQPPPAASPLPFNPAAAPPQSVQPGTLPPGTVVNVGEFTVTVERFLSEGGFAHVYLANSTVPLPKGAPNASTKHVLKRMVVQNKRGVEEVGREVDVMRQLRNHPKIVNMIEASVADLPGGVDGSKGYEIYILMEWCQGGGIIDMMNTRLQNRLTESEILKIFSDVVEAVAHMHYQSPPLIHRDLKVENILLSPPQTYKLCDFGSTTRPLPREKVPTAVEGIQKIEMEINKTTTLQYRAPELVDVWGRKGFDEKIDIWALGVFLYKLCFYTTPFEEHGPLAILNAQYKFPPFPAYSSNIRSLIAAMLQERASQRPNIYQVHEMVCRLRGAPVRLENKYALAPSATGSSSIGLPRAQTLSPSAGAPISLPSSPVPRPTSSIISNTAIPAAGAGVGGSFAGLAEQIAPMRRGRPNKAGGPAPEANRLVRTGLAAVGSQGEKPAPGSSASEWESFASSSAKSPGFPSGFDSAPPAINAGESTSGFGDTFAPPKGLETSLELPKNAAMFAELVPPSRAQVESGRTSPMDLLRKQRDQAAAPTAKPVPLVPEKQDDDDRKRFEAAFPDLDSDPDFAAFRPGAQPSAPSKPQPPSLIDAPTPPPTSSMPSQLTGETPGPPLPRRPPVPAEKPDRLPTPGAPSPAPSPTPQSAQQPPRPGFKPELVSRASQTSPHLLASWRNGSSSSSSAAPASGATTGGAGQSSLRQSSVPGLELSSPGDSPVLLSGEGAPKKVVDLLGSDDEDDGFAPRSVATDKSLVASPSSAGSALPPLPSPSADSAAFDKPPPTTSLTGNVASKRMSFSSSPSSATGGFEREKFRPTKRTSWLPSNGNSPAGSPKPSLPPKSIAAQQEKEERKEEAPEQSVEERFPALAIDEPSGGLKIETKPADDQWEKLVEKEEADDSSDDEASAAPPAKMSAPAFDDDDFRPPSTSQQAPSLSGRPKLGGGSKPSFSAAPTEPSRNLSASPAPLNSSSSISPTPTSVSRQYSTSSSSSTGGGGIDLGPALASIHRFAPSGNNGPPPAEQDEDNFPAPSPRPASAAAQPASPALSAASANKAPLSPPPIASPKPQPAHRTKAGLGSLVSRYEGLQGPLTGGPPPPGHKPVGLRKDSTGSSLSSATGGGVSAHGYQRDTVQPRALPQWAAAPGGGRSPVPAAVEEEAQEKPASAASPPPALPPKPSTPTFGGGAGRAPFKPVPPPGSPSAEKRAASGRPAFGSSGGKPGSPAPVPASAKAAHNDDGDAAAEERFAGVSNMKSRWESMARDQAGEQGKGRAGGAKRKEWAAI